MKKLVAFMGSPRKNANTDNIVKAIAEGAEAAGAETQIFYLKDMNIGFCIGCFYCRNKDTCVLKDDMAQIYEALKDASAVVIGAPIYFYQVNGMVKNLIDRLFPIIDMPPAPRFGTKKAAMVYTSGAPIQADLQPYMDQTNQAVSMLGFDIQDTIYFSSGNDPRAIANSPEVLAKAKELGKKLVD